jgi:hypothetical protein
LIRPGLHTAGHRMGEYERGGDLEFAAQQAGGAGRLEAQRPPVLAAGEDLGEFHLAPGLLARPPDRAAICWLADENRLIRRRLCTGRQPAGPALCWLSGPKGNDHFCQDCICPRARPATSSIPGLPRDTFTSSALPPRTFTDSPGNGGSSR